MCSRPDDTETYWEEEAKSQKASKKEHLRPRKPTAKEKYELAQYTVAQGYDEESAKVNIEGAAIAVFDDYMTGGPGYTGKVMVVIWDGAPSFYEVFVWDNGKMRKEECEF